MPPRAYRTGSAVLAAMLVLSMLVGCTDDEDDAAAEGEPAVTAELDDLVSLTIYLRTGGSPEDLLEPVTREVPIGDDLPRRAVQLLLDGPEGDDEEDLESAWPEGTELNAVNVSGGTATVDFSGEVLADPPEPQRAPHMEALALASLANTLTEFPAVEQVKVTIDGEDVGSESVEEFWGGWGLPERLARDVTLVTDKSEEGPPALEDFATDGQSVGGSEADPVVVRSIRVRDRITYVRVVVELADADEPESSAADFPRTYARSDPGELALEVTGVEEVGGSAVPSDLAEQLEPLFTGFELGEGRRPNSMQLTLRPAGSEHHRVYLHTSTSPSRIVLDVKK